MRRNLPQHPPQDRQDDQSNNQQIESTSRNVVPINDAGAVFDALAQEIKGSAVGWPADALKKLEDALEDRYGHLIGGPAAVERLLILAQQPAAA